VPTTVRYVDTDADSGGDGTTSATSSGDGSHAYDTLANWAAGEFPIGNNISHYVYCNRGTTTPRDTTAVDLSAVSIGNNSLVYILPNDTAYDPYTGADASSYHYGVYDAGYVLYTSANFTATLKISNKVIVRGIEIRNDPPSVNGGTGFQTDATTQQTHRDIISRSTGGTYTANQAFRVNSGILENCIADHYSGGSSSTSGFYGVNYGKPEFTNCLAANCYTGFISQVTGGIDPICINCVAVNCTADYTDGGGGWDTTNSTNCATSDASASESWVTVTSVSTSDGVDFVAPSTKDWRPTSGGKLTNAGSANGTAVDIALEARS